MCNKRKYYRRADAKTTMIKMKSKGLHIYWCKECSAMHLGHKYHMDKINALIDRVL